MAQRHIVQLIDDIDGGNADETVTFALDGVSYEIDLTTDNAEQLRDSLARWIVAGRRIGRVAAGTTQRRSASGASSTKRQDLDAVRAWARDNGHEVSDRGRVAARILEAYDAAH